MRNTILFFLCIFFLPAFSQPSNSLKDSVLIPVYNNGWGFINTSGEEVIPTVFREVRDFTGSLAAARKDNNWGFINRNGVYAIPPIYDFVIPFSEGYAAVWKDGIPFLIDTNGEILFALSGSKSSFRDRLMEIIHLPVEFICPKDSTRRLFSIKANGDITPFKNPNIPVWSPKDRILVRQVPGAHNIATYQYAVQDSIRSILVPYGVYSKIDSFRNGFAAVTITPPVLQMGGVMGVINEKGQLLFSLPKGSGVEENYFSEGLLAVYTSRDTNMSWHYGKNITWYDTAGKMICVQKEAMRAMPFQNGRCFFNHSYGGWYLMDKTGKTIGPHRFKCVQGKGFVGDIAFVASAEARNSDLDDLVMELANYTNPLTITSEMKLQINDLFHNRDLYGVIDTTGNYVIPPIFSAIHSKGFQKEGLLVETWEPIQEHHHAPLFRPVRKLWGMVDRKGSWIFPAQFTKVSPQGFENGLLYAEIDSLYGYIDRNGTFLWCAVRPTGYPLPQKLDIDFMRPARYLSGGRRSDESIESYLEKRTPSSAALEGFKEKGLGIEVRTNEHVLFQDRYEGITAYLYNTGSDTIEVAVLDRALYMHLQAADPQGRWRDIEYLPSSYCGNSFFDLLLAPDEFWTFRVPVYDGTFSTMLRIVYSGKGRSGLLQGIYSDPFPGKINPAQFWRHSDLEGQIPGY